MNATSKTFGFAVVGFLVLVAVSRTFAAETLDAARQTVNSFSRGERIAYRSKGKTKAQGLDVEFQIPKTWKERVTERSVASPNIVAFFEPDNSSEPSVPICHFQVQAMSDELVAQELGVSLAEVRSFWERVTPHEEELNLANDMFSNEAMRTMFQEYSNLPILDFSNKRIQIDGWPGAITSGRISYKSTRTGLEIPGYCMVVNVLYKNYLAGIYISIPKDPIETENSFRQRYAIYQSLIQSIGSTITIHSQYSGVASSKNEVRERQPETDSSRKQSVTPTHSESLVVVKQVDSNLYLCRRNGELLVVDCSAHSRYRRYDLQRGNRISGTIVPKPEQTIQTTVNGRIETLPIVGLIEGNNAMLQNRIDRNKKPQSY